MGPPRACVWAHLCVCKRVYLSMMWLEERINKGQLSNLHRQHAAVRSLFLFFFSNVSIPCMSSSSSSFIPVIPPPPFPNSGISQFILQQLLCLWLWNSHAKKSSGWQSATAVASLDKALFLESVRMKVKEGKKQTNCWLLAAIWQIVIMVTSTQNSSLP